MAIPVLSQAWSLARRVEDLLKLQAKTADTLGVIDERFTKLEVAIGVRLQAVEDRLTRLEVGQAQVGARPKARQQPRLR